MLPTLCNMEITASSCSHSHSNPKPNAAAALVEQTIKRSLVPPKWKDSVRAIGLSEHREAALTLAHAFAADDYAKYLVDPDLSAVEDKWKLHVDIMNYAVAAHCINGLVTTIGPDYDSVALWYAFLFFFFALCLLESISIFQHFVHQQEHINKRLIRDKKG